MWLQNFRRGRLAKGRQKCDAYVKVNVMLRQIRHYMPGGMLQILLENFKIGSLKKLKISATMG
jgi:hypothetical protein